MAFSLTPSLHCTTPATSLSYPLSGHCRLSLSCKATNVPPTETRAATDFYKILSLSSTKAGTAEIKRAYRAMALKYHPDVCDEEESVAMFVQLHEAYRTLTDPVSRQEYDLRLSLGNFARICKIGGDHEIRGKRWEGQVEELRRRCSYGYGQKEGSWGSRMRARNREN